MSFIRFRTSDLDLELRGSEPFVLRQLLRLAPTLGRVDSSAFAGATAPPAPEAAPPPEPEPVEIPAAAAPEAVELPASAEPAPVAGGNGEGEDDLVRFYRSFPAPRRDDQAEAALLFAYYLQRQEGLSALRLGDLLRCCMRVGVDSRNFHRSLGMLTRRGLIEEVRRGESYRISGQGIAAVEEMRG